MRTLLTLCICVAVPCASLASDPGQPLDCSDFVFLESGHACSIVEECFSPDSCDQAGTPGLYDNEGRFLFLDFIETVIGGRVELLFSMMATISWATSAWMYLASRIRAIWSMTRS